MTPQKTQFLDELIKHLTEETRSKFIKGDEEHGTKSNIWDIPINKLLDEAINESIDQYVYLYTLRFVLPDLLAHLKILEDENKALREVSKVDL